jgi:Protein of unknown function (DUF3224)
MVEFLQAGRADGSASFVGIERVTGAVGGRTGTFLLQDAGTVEGNVVSGDWFVSAERSTVLRSGYWRLPDGPAPPVTTSAVGFNTLEVVT